MTHVVWANQPWLIDWLCERIGLVPTRHITAIGRADDLGHLIGVVGYDGWSGCSCEMHMAGEPGWITLELIRAAFWYPFVHAGCKVVFGRVSSANEAALSIDRRLGFRLVATIPDGHPDGALHVLAMHRDECRWIEREPEILRRAA